MKMIYGGVPVQSLKVKHYELNTNGATTVPSAVQAGLTYYANGRKEVGTGKSFEFASYGSFPTNDDAYVPSDINIIQISSRDNPVQVSITLGEMKNQDFAVQTEIGNVFIDGISYPIFAVVSNNILSITCEQSVILQVFYGKDNYI